MQNTAERYDERTFCVNIDSYENGVPVGNYRNLFFEEKETFKSLTQLLVKLDQCLDQENIPQPFQKVRTFGMTSDIRFIDFAERHAEKGKMATFIIRVYFRQNVSWQGSITWIDENRTQKFRSVMELIFLLNSALLQKEDFKA